tara:strand:+ start:2792 stop:3964 length:1173 start_codon:yes stop_codon:yes gene_type:complete
MKIYLKQNVWDAALERIEHIFDEFDDVVVSFSGGKDSTVTFQLAMMVAERRNRLPLKVMFLDQEAEWQNVIDYVRDVMTDLRVDPMWFQMPIRMTNSTSNDQHFLHCWTEGDDEDWMRPKEDFAITENIYGTDRFFDLFPAIMKHHWPNKKLAVLAGVRAEESPARLAGLTTAATYKWITWGKAVDKKVGQYNFYPLYDWSYTDIWKSIHEHGWQYAKAYDYFYQYGISPTKMRVSNLHHETAVHQLFYLQEIERDTWNKLTKRLEGINQARHMTKEDMFQAKKLPYMFKDWKEYRDHLLVNLVTDQSYQDAMRKRFHAMDEKYGLMKDVSKLHKVHIATVLAQDIDFTKCSNFEQNPYAITYRRWRRGEPKDIKFVQKSEAKDWIPVTV